MFLRSLAWGGLQGSMLLILPALSFTCVVQTTKSSFRYTSPERSGLHTIVQMGMLQLRWALAAGDHGIFSMSACQANLGLEARFRPGTRKQQVFRKTLRAYERGCGHCHLTLHSLTLDVCSKNLPPSSPPGPGIEVGEDLVTSERVGSSALTS